MIIIIIMIVTIIIIIYNSVFQTLQVDLNDTPELLTCHPGRGGEPSPPR